MQRQAVADRVGGEQSAKVVGGVHRLTGIGQPGDGGEVGQNLTDAVPSQHLVAGAKGACEQVRERFAVDRVVGVVGDRQRHVILAGLRAAQNFQQHLNSSGVIGMSRSLSVLDGTMCSNGTSVAVVGAV